MRALFAASLGLALALPGAATATVGTLDYRDCVSSDAATTGCTNISATTSALDGATHAVAVSGDGTSVYVAATNGDAVAHHSRDLATGSLTFRDCIAAGDAPASGCSNITPTTNSLESPTAITITRDGRDVYVAGALAVAHLRRDTITGSLTFADCISSDISTTGCAHVNGVTAAVSAFDALRLGADDRSLYGAGASRLVHLTRSQLDGSLLFNDCLSGGATTGCADVTASSNGFGSLESVAPSADGKSLYAGGDGTVFNLRLNASGTPSFGDCLTSSGATGCTALVPSAAFSGLENVVVSPDGANAYTTAETGGLTTLRRNSTSGTLTFDACIASGAVAGCTDVSSANGAVTSLDGVTVSPDGGGVYAVGANAAVHLLRDPSTGALTPADCFSLNAVTGCTAVNSITNSLNDLQEVALSPGGESAYVAAEASDAMLHFRRQVAPACTDTSVAVAHDTPTAVALTCTDANGDALTRSIGTGPSHGALGAIDQGAGNVLYTPSSGFAGSDLFTFAASDGRDSSQPATATLAVGAASPPTKDTTAPVITKLSVKATRRKRGGTVRFTLSEPASVTITIQRRRTARRFVTLGSFKRSGKRGANRKAFAGKLAKRRLGPGRYRARARATDAAGNRSKTRSVAFRVKP